MLMEMGLVCLALLSTHKSKNSSLRAYLYCQQHALCTFLKVKKKI